MDEAWERAVEAALEGQTNSAAAQRTLSLDGVVKCLHGRLPPPGLPPPGLLEKFQSLSLRPSASAFLTAFPRHHFVSNPAPGHVAPSSLEIAAWRDTRRPLGVHAVAGGNRHVSGSFAGKPTSDSSRVERPLVSSAPSSLASSAIDFLTLCRHLKAFDEAIRRGIIQG